MKLLSCRIEGFGGLVDEELTFDGGLNSYCFANGWGKSTLCAFLRAVFYGLPSDRANSKGLSDRTHYKPFSGARYGGSVRFEKDGKIYRVERFFDAKSDKRDELAVYCGAERSEAFGECVGKSVFGLDEESFTRVLYVSPDDLGTGTTGDIKTRLNAFMDDGSNLDLALKVLDTERKKYRADRGNGGLINGQNERVSAIRADIYAARSKNEMLGEAYSRRVELAREKSRLDGEYKSAAGGAATEAKRQAYRRYLSTAEGEREKARAIAAAYSDGVPEASGAESVQRDVAEARGLESAIRQLEFGEGKRSRLEGLRGRFAEEPTKTEIEKCKRIVSGEGAGGNAPSGGKDTARGKRLALLACGIAVVCVIAAVVLAIAGVLYGAVACGVVGLLFAAFAVALLLKGKTKAADAVEDRRTADGAEYLNKFLAKFGYDGGADGFARFESDWGEYCELCAEESAIDGRRKLLKNQLDGTYARINGFFSAYHIDYAHGYEAAIARVLRDVSEINRLEMSAQAYVDNAQKYAAENDVSDSKESGESRGLEEITAEIDAVNVRLIAADKLIEECEESAERLIELNAELEREEERRGEYEHRYMLLKSAADCLRRADGAIAERLVAPVRSRYAEYLQSAGVASDGIEMDKNFNVLTQQGGALRGEEYLSSGQRTVSTLCFRLALADEIFGGSAPFMLMDDPFVHLDEERFVGCANAVKRLSATRQLLYFTCHNSRSIKN